MVRSSHRSGHRVVSLAFLILVTFLAPGAAEFIADGVALTPLTRDGKSSAISWAYQGDLIAVEREISDTQSQLVIMKADGSNEVRASRIGHLVFVEWSWSGTKLAYEFTNAPESESQGGVFIYDIPTKRTRAAAKDYEAQGDMERDLFLSQLSARRYAKAYDLYRRSGNPAKAQEVQLKIH